MFGSRKRWAAPTTDHHCIDPMTTITCAAVWLLLPLIVLIGVALWLSESTQQRIQRLHRSGYSQTRIAQHLNISRYAVRKALA